MEMIGFFVLVGFVLLVYGIVTSVCDTQRPVSMFLRGRNANKFQTLMEHRGFNDPEELMKEMLQVYEYLVQESMLSTRFYKKEAGGKVEPCEFFEQK